MAGGAGGHEVERIAVKVVPDTGGFRQELVRELEAAEAGVKVEIPVELKDTADVRAKLENLARDVTAKLRVELENVARIRQQLARLARDRLVLLRLDVDTGAIEGRLNHLARNRGLTVRVDLDLTRARAQLAAFLRPRKLTIRADVDRNSIGMLLGTLGRVSAQLGNITRRLGDMGQMTNITFQMGVRGASQFARAMGPLQAILAVVLVAAIGVLIGAIAGLIVILVAAVGALLAIVPVAALVGGALYYLFTSNDKQAKKFRKSVESVKKTAQEALSFAIRPMAKAISEQIPRINRFIRVIQIPLAVAFSHASKHVGTLTKALMGFSMNLMKGVVQALLSPNLKKAIDGFRKFIEDLGTALGEFFRVLAYDGDKYQKVFDELGESMKQLLPELASLAGAFADISPGLIRFLTAALMDLFAIFKDEGNLRAISRFAKISFAAIVATIATIVANIRFTLNLWQALYDAAVWTVNKIIDIWNRCVAWVKRKWTEMKNAAYREATGMRAQVSSTWSSMVSRLQSILNRLSTWVSSIWSRITGRTRTGANSTRSAAIGPFNGMASAISGVMNRIVGIISSAWSRISGIAGRISGAISSIVAKASRIGGILDKIPFFLPAPEFSDDGDDAPVRKFFPGFPQPDGGEGMVAKAPSLFRSFDDMSGASRALGRIQARIDRSADTPDLRSPVPPRVFNFTTYAAPNIPTERQFVKWLDYADTLYAT